MGGVVRLRSGHPGRPGAGGPPADRQCGPPGARALPPHRHRAAYACHLVLLNPAADILAGLAIFLFVWNLQRLSVAGTGMAPHLTPEEASHWRSSLMPMLLFAYLGFLGAQALCLLLMAAPLDREIDAYRDQLVATHREALRDGPLENLFIRSYDASRQAKALGARIGVFNAQLSRTRAILAEDPVKGTFGPVPALERQRMEGECTELERSLVEATTALRLAEHAAAEAQAEAARREAAEVATFRVNLEASGFLTQRLLLVWRRPFLPILLGLLGALAAALPLLNRHRKGHNYEQARHRAARDRIEQAGLAVHAEVDRLLQRYPTHLPEHGIKYLDPPFDMRRPKPGPIEAKPLTGKDLLDLLPGGS